MRQNPPAILPEGICFNPRTRKGCDEGRTWMQVDCMSFNPRTRKGCDFNDRFGLTQSVLFQSTHP